MENSKLFKTSVILYFIAYFVVALICMKDYGIQQDEEAQRKHSLVAYKYINETLFSREIPELADIPKLETYKSKYYGTAFQIPLVVVEDLRHFNMSNRNIYLMRHLTTFLLVFTGYVALFFALKSLFKENKWLALIGTMFVSLYPRYFVYQFVDIKNIGFAGFVMITFYFLVKSVEEKKWYMMLLFSLFAAFATNQRVIGVIFPAAILSYFLAIDLTEVITQKMFSAKGLIKYLLIIVSFYGFWILITPASWSNPFEAFAGTTSKFSDYPTGGSTLFMGKLLTRQGLPWYYIPVWIGISIPLLILILFILDHFLFLKDVIKAPNKATALFDTYKWETCLFAMFWGVTGYLILKKSSIQGGWHHIYFTFVFISILAVFALERITKKFSPKLILSAVVLSLVVQCSWMFVNHPSQAVFLNIIGKPFGDQFLREEWRSSSLHALKWIMNNEEGNFALAGGYRKSMLLLSDEERNRIKLSGEGYPEYIIECYSNELGNAVIHEGFEEVYTMWVDNYKVCSVFKLK